MLCRKGDGIGARDVEIRGQVLQVTIAFSQMENRRQNMEKNIPAI